MEGLPLLWLHGGSRWPGPCHRQVFILCIHRQDVRVGYATTNPFINPFTDYALSKHVNRKSGWFVRRSRFQAVACVSEAWGGFVFLTTISIWMLVSVKLKLLSQDRGSYVLPPFSLTEYCLLHLLLKKNPDMFSQHFIECIFHFNSYTKHKSYNKFSQSERYDPVQLDFSLVFPHVTTCLLSLFLFYPRRERVHFSLKGEQYREKRFRIYCFLLEHFTDAQRFNITNKINQTILGKLKSKVLGFSFQSWACC